MPYHTRLENEDKNELTITDRITGRESRQVIPPQRMADPLPFPFNVITLNMGLGGRRA